MNDEVSGNEGTPEEVPAPTPAKPAATVQPAQPTAPPAQPAQQPVAEEPSDHLGRRILLWVGRIVVAIVYIYCMLGIIVLSFRFFLLLFGASADASFSNWVYSVSSEFMEPFAGMIEISQPTGGSYVDVNSLFAIAAYAVIAWLVHMAYEWIRHRLWVVEHSA